MSAELQKIIMFVLVVVSQIVNTMTSNIEIGNAQEADSGLRMYNALEAKITDVPYVTRIHVTVKNIKNRYSLCTGAIIHRSWVLSAAHCVFEKIIDKVEIFAGLMDRREISSSQAKVATQMIHHPKYEKRIYRYDLLLLKVDSDFEMNEKVQVIQLSNDPWPQGEYKYNRECLTAGWGVIEGKKAATKLMYREVVARHGIKGCKCDTPRQNKFRICVELNTGGKTCHGDSGGAMVCNGKAVGVVLSGYHPEECNPLYSGDKTVSCNSSIDAYSYICPELNWIASHVPGIPASPDTCKCSFISPPLPIIIATTVIQLIN